MYNSCKYNYCKYNIQGNFLCQKQNLIYNKNKNKKPITNYCGIYKKIYNSKIEYPNNISKLQNIVKNAYINNIKLRIRGGGYSCSNNNIPKNNEKLIILDKFNKYIFEEEDTITVGAGVDVYTLYNFLKDMGYSLLTSMEKNNLGITIGGFISAGGMRPNINPNYNELNTKKKYINENEEFGFWEEVKGITLINGLGNLVTYNINDEEFQWLFSNFGQLGIIISAKIKIKKISKGKYPFKKEGKIDKTNETNYEKVFSYMLIYNQEKNYNIIKKKTKNLFLKYYDDKEIILFNKTIIKFKNFNPPLLYQNKDIKAIFIIVKFNKNKINNMEKDYKNFINNNNIELLHRYPQADFIDMDYIEEYYKKRGNVFSKLMEYKKIFDPHNIINPL